MSKTIDEFLGEFLCEFHGRVCMQFYRYKHVDKIHQEIHLEIHLEIHIEFI